MTLRAESTPAAASATAAMDTSLRTAYFTQCLFSKKIDGMYVYIDPEFRDGEFANKHWVK